MEIVTQTSTFSVALTHLPLSSVPLSGLTVDILQDLVDMVASPEFVFAIDVEQDHYYIFWVEFRSASSQRPHPVHTFDAPDDHLVSVVGQLEVYDDSVFVYRCVGNTGDIASRTTSIQVIDRRKGHTRV